MLVKLAHPDGDRQIHLGAWKKQEVDTRDEKYKIKIQNHLATIPSSIDNRPICSPIEDQGELGSCTANMFAALVESNENRSTAAKLIEIPSVNWLSKLVFGNCLFKSAAAQINVSSITRNSDGSISYNTTVKANKTTNFDSQVNISSITVKPNSISYSTVVKPVVIPPAPPAPTPPAPPAPPVPPVPPAPPAPPAPPHQLVRASRLFEYYATRQIEGTVSEDSGATIRDAVKAGNLYGVADESLWPYDISKFTINPPQNVWSAAVTHKVTSYHAVNDGDIATMKSVLASGYLIGFGFVVYDYMMSAEMARTGILKMPTSSETVQGGHAVCLVGYNDAEQMFLVRNSWGTAWGLSGYFKMPYAYIQNTSLANDFWVIQSSPI